MEIFGLVEFYVRAHPVSDLPAAVAVATPPR
jgi:hypothetical protein